MQTVRTDVAIIGAGTAGLTAYRAAKKQGKRALLIESTVYGTMCARVGCMPSKLLIAAANAAHGMRQAAAFGVHMAGKVQVDGREVMARVRAERDRFVRFVVQDVDGFPDEDKLMGQARFLSPTRLQVGDHSVVEATSVVIATGSTPVLPDMYKAAGERLITNDDVFSWHDLPKRVFVVGTGVIGLELGQALARLGVRVVLAGRSQSLAGISDPEVKAAALLALQSELDLCLEADVRQVTHTGSGVQVRYARSDGIERIELFDYVLMAAGRRPQLDGLDLTAAGARLDARGMPEFDAATLQLNGLPIFLAGDVNAMHPLLHEAADDGYLAGQNAATYPDVQPGQRRAPLSIVFTEPQVARVGLAYRDLPEDAVIGAVDFRHQGRSRIMLENHGMLRVYAQAGSGRLLGAELAGPRAEHLAHLLAWAIQQSLTVQHMLTMPFYHPVIEEGLRTALRDASRRLA